MAVVRWMATNLPAFLAIDAQTSAKQLDPGDLCHVVHVDIVDFVKEVNCCLPASRCAVFPINISSFLIRAGDKTSLQIHFRSNTETL
jgi:hypothetical protein